MIDVVLLGIIRSWHFREHVYLREISKKLDISRNTVRRYYALKSSSQPTLVDVLEKYAFKLSAWLKTEATKSLLKSEGKTAESSIDQRFPRDALATTIARSLLRQATG